MNDEWFREANTLVYLYGKSEVDFVSFYQRPVNLSPQMRSDMVAHLRKNRDEAKSALLAHLEKALVK